MNPANRPTDWSDRVYNIVAAACQVATVALMAAHMGVLTADAFRRWWDRLKWRYRQWEFQCFYDTVWSARRALRGESG